MSESPDPESPKRRAILTAATELFAARGYGAVSMDAVARAADVSKATLYAHFTSKDLLFATIVKAACQENFDPGDDLADTGRDIAAALHAIGGRILRFFLEPRSLAIHRLVVAECVRFPELGLAFYENGPVAGRETLAAWMAARPELTVPEPRQAAEQFTGLLRAGLFFRATLGVAPAPSEAEIDAVVSASVRTFLRAFRRPANHDERG